MPLRLPARRLTLWLGAAAALTIAAGGVAFAASTPAAVSPCHSADVAYFFGPVVPDGQNHLHADITLVAQPGVTCRLSDRPDLSFAGPDSDEHPIHVKFIGTTGRGLNLSSGSPLHTTMGWYNRDTVADTAFVATVTLRMPGGGRTYPAHFPNANGTEPYPFDEAIARGPGFQLLPWQTGLGEGQGTSPF